jgi:hypothetical protein
MKNFFFILIFTYTSYQSIAQCNNTFVYGFELVGIKNPELITATVFYNGTAIVPRNKVICNRTIKTRKNFLYLKNNSNTIDGIKMPYELPKNRFYWLMTDDMNIEMAVHPNRYKIILNSNNSSVKKRYELPISYDFISQNAIYLDLLDKSKKNMESEFLNKIWQFAVFKKQTITKIIKDTTLVYSLREPIPRGILQIVPQLNLQEHSVQEFSIGNCYLIENTFLMPIKSSEKIIKNYHDGITQNFTNIEGKICSKAGGITGMGTVLCAKIKTSKIKYKLTLIIEP